MSVAARALAVVLVATSIGCRTRADVSARADAAVDAGTDGACRRDEDCAKDAFCVFAPGLCGRGPRPGACVARPHDCPRQDSPVCGCDGAVYPSECAAHAAGVDLDVTGACRDPVPGWAPCGAHYCDADTSYCEIYLSDVPEIPTDHFCRPLPEGCLRLEAGARTCECFPAATPCRSFCGPLPTGGRPSFHLTCQGRSPPAAP